MARPPLRPQSAPARRARRRLPRGDLDYGGMVLELATGWKVGGLSERADTDSCSGRGEIKVIGGVWMFQRREGRLDLTEGSTEMAAVQ